MATKFDTNPLDPDFPERARAAAANDTSRQTAFATAPFPQAPPSVTEEETRRLEPTRLGTYSMPVGGEPLVYPKSGNDSMNRTSDRREIKTGLPEKWLIMLPYLPFSIGLIAGLVVLLAIPKEETKIRFHAAQGLAAHVGILFITALLGALGNVVGVAEIASFIFTITATVMLVVFAIKAWSGKPVHIESVDALTNWLEDKIGPLK